MKKKSKIIVSTMLVLSLCFSFATTGFAQALQNVDTGSSPLTDAPGTAAQIADGQPGSSTQNPFISNPIQQPGEPGSTPDNPIISDPVQQPGEPGSTPDNPIICEDFTKVLPPDGIQRPEGRSTGGTWKVGAGGRWWYDLGNGKYLSNSWDNIPTGSNSWYYFDGDGYMVTGWIQLGGYWYYLDETAGSNLGMMAFGWRLIAGKYYYFNASGHMMTGWIDFNGKTYYCDASGVMRTGWITVGGKNYYMNPPNGEMLKNIIGIIEGKMYSLDSSGAARTGHFELDFGEYFAAQNGEMYVEKWLVETNAKYYYGSKGVLKETVNKCPSGYYDYADHKLLLSGGSVDFMISNSITPQMAGSIIEGVKRWNTSETSVSLVYTGANVTITKNSFSDSTVAAVTKMYNSFIAGDGIQCNPLKVDWTHASIEFNESNSLFNGSATITGNIAAHEFGHTLGLRHTQDTNDLMFNKINNATPPLSVSSYDLQVLKHLYGG